MREYEINVRARDGRQLSAIMVEAEKPRFSVVLSPATGVRKEFYLRLARDGAARGAAVLLYDYRGQGRSAGADLRVDTVDFLDWGRQDLPAAIEHLDRLHPKLEMASIGHSAGGWIAGLAPNHSRISRHAFVCVGWCYWRLKPLWFKALELSLWHLYGPACKAIFGYIPRGGLWRGEPLNPRLFETWKRWCHSPRCEPAVLAGGPGAPHYFDQVSAPIRSFGYSDDPIANRNNVELLLSCYSRAKSDVVWAQPRDFGLSRIGHHGVFRNQAKQAWAPIWNWLDPTRAIEA